MNIKDNTYTYKKWWHSLLTRYHLNGKNFSTKLKLQLTSSFVIISSVLIIISSLCFYKFSVDIIKNRYQEDTLRQSRQLENNINSFFNDIDMVSGMLIVSPPLEEYLQLTAINDVESLSLIKDIFAGMEKIIKSYDYIDSIYYFGENGTSFKSSKSSTRYVNYDYEQTKFYKSDLYGQVKSQKQENNWYSGYVAEDFDFNVVNNDSKKYPLITSARKIEYMGKHLASLVINVKEDYFRSIYYDNANESEYDRYIIDRKGEIASHVNSVKIGQGAGFFKQIKEKQSKEGSLQIGTKSQKTQMVYYSLERTGWYIVDEIKVSLLEKDVKILGNLTALIVSLSILFSLIISFYWIYTITKPLSKLSDTMNKVEKGALGLNIDPKTQNQLGVLGRQFNKMSTGIVGLIEDNRIIENEKHALEIESLKSQINPHFIYNTMSTIKWMAIVSNSNNIAECITALGKILQPAFKKGNNLCTLKEELDIIESYIIIMNYRYGNNIHLSVFASEELNEQVVPRFMLQPIVENCILHGNPNLEKQLQINIKTEITQDILTISISDNGAGIPQDRLLKIKNLLSGERVSDKNADDKMGIGMCNVNRRIQLCFSKQYGVEIESELSCGTTVRIKLPFVQKS